MPYLIDGHNLVPSAGLRLDSPDDELELIGVLQEFSRNSRSAVEVYFDGAPVGSSGTRRIGLVTAHFVSSRTSADAAIMARLNSLGRSARNWTVVSSDREVRAAATSAQAATETSPQFAARIKQARQRMRRRESPPAESVEGMMSEQELQGWIDFFKQHP